MSKIVVKRKAVVYKEFQIKPDQKKITIGLDGDNDLIIADKKAGRNHLTIEKEMSHYYISNLKSEFPTYLNKKEISDKERIIDGDEITIGDHSLVFVNGKSNNNRNVEPQQ